jgi:amidase
MSHEPFFSRRFHYSWGPHEPTLRIESGTRLRVVCPDSDNGLADGSELPREARHVSAGTAHFEGNPLAGPIFVTGATTSDCLRVQIHSIELDDREGRTLLAPAHGFLSRDQLQQGDAAAGTQVPRHMYRWHIDRVNGTARLLNPLGDETWELPLRPMIGSIGVCPGRGEVISSLGAGQFGGNLDLPLIRAGSFVLLPVFHGGALLQLGDLHAAQGAGEIVGGGIEVSGTVDLSVARMSDYAISSPRILVDGAVFTVAVGGDLRQAVAGAYAELVQCLVVDFELSRWDAYQIVSQTGRVELGGVVAPNCQTVAAGLPLDVLPKRCAEIVERWTESVGQ